MGTENMVGLSSLFWVQKDSLPGLILGVRLPCGAHMGTTSTIRQRGMSALRQRRHSLLLHLEPQMGAKFGVCSSIPRWRIRLGVTTSSRIFSFKSLMCRRHGHLELL